MFVINQITSDVQDLEQLGTKEKFWYATNTGKWLFKFSRTGTGEHWSEKCAEQLCIKLGIPCATYELAECHGRPGVITPNLVFDGFNMVMGNEVLHQFESGYPKPEGNDEKRVKVREHTVSRVLGCLDAGHIKVMPSPFGLENLSPGDVFCGYLMLDALISNQDRHHENWAILVNGDTGERFLCPTYDHAASLGRELTTERRISGLTSKDKNQRVESFVSKARSLLFRLKNDKKPLLTIDAFYCAGEKKPSAKAFWLERLRGLTDEDLQNIVNSVPEEYMDKYAKSFAFEMLKENKRRLLNHEIA